MLNNTNEIPTFIQGVMPERKTFRKTPRVFNELKLFEQYRLKQAAENSVPKASELL
ncbi:hypothetical protein MAH4_28340 [Sessilibacter sp. MAH4]